MLSLIERASFPASLAGLLCVASLAASGASSGNWPQAAGPNGDWSASGRSVPIHWSVARNENIVWRTSLPEEGQSGIAVWEDRLFLTTMKPLPPEAKSKEGHDVVGYCLDSRTGKILWTVDLPGSADSTYAYGFSDSTTPSPVTDGKYVWFFNASGALGCFDFAGKQVWLRRWEPTVGRPFNKQFEPILSGNTLLNMEPRDPDDPKREAKDPWNYLRGLDKYTGKTLWVSDDALTHYNTPVLGRTADGVPAVLVGRGAHHDVPEAPVGLSLVSLASGQEGRTLWRHEGQGKTLYTMHWDRKYAYWFPEDTPVHHVLDAATGKLVKTQSLVDRVDYRRYDPAAKAYVLREGIDLKKQDPPLRVFPGWFTNIVVDGWHYFLCFTDKGIGPAYSVGRVNVETDKVEYLEVPVQVVRKPGQPDQPVWGEPQSSSTVNARGVDVAGDPRSKRDGWYWCFLGNPTAVDGKIFFTTMLGVTYVIDGRARVLDEKALLSVNDLGPAGETWSLNSISYAGGRLFHRSMREVVCIGKR
jgi:hypothetical protein